MKTKRNSNGGNGGGDFRMIPLAQITPSTTNPRGLFDAEGVERLAESIKQHGVLQPILVRTIGEHGASGARFEIVAGERRFRAAQLAGLNTIPARVVMMSDTEALEVQIIENLQREDVHPLDEADGFMHLKEATKLDLSQIAQRLARDERYVTRRLALVNLIGEAKIDFREERITLAHALEICRLAPDIQQQALAACYERKPVWNQKDQTHTYAPDKEKPARHVKYLQAWLAQNVHLNLHKAPFKMDDPRLRADNLTCVACPQRTGYHKGLFEDVKNGDTCLNPGCFRAKIKAFVHIRKAELDAKGLGRPTAYISSFYETPKEQKDALSRYEYQLLEKKTDRCRDAEQAVYVDGTEIGQVRWICRRKDCKDHLGRVRQSYPNRASGGGRQVSPEDRKQRKQELFNIRVDEIVCKRVMAEALKTYRHPLERVHLDGVACEFFRRIASDDQRTILEVFGWGEKEVTSLRMNGDKVLAELAELDDNRLAQFLMLCSFAHFGENQYKQQQVSQQQVVKLSTERGVNHTLIDAQVRLELAPKKYRASHQAYLDAATEGKAAARPVVYEQPPKRTPDKEAPQERAVRTAATKRDAKRVERTTSPRRAEPSAGGRKKAAKAGGGPATKKQRRASA